LGLGLGLGLGFGPGRIRVRASVRCPAEACSAPLRSARPPPPPPPPRRTPCGGGLAGGLTPGPDPGVRCAKVSVAWRIRFLLTCEATGVR
jgi:hypothetical protein